MSQDQEDEQATLPDPDWRRVDDLLYSCFERPPEEIEQAVEAACAANPKHAERMRRCFAKLKDAGLMDGLAPASGASPAASAGGDFGDFRLVERLGAGGMGVVWLAEQRTLGRRVALKIIRGEFGDSETALARFKRESQAASKLEHPGICPVYEVGEVDGTPYLVMPCLEGRTLAEEIRETRENTLSGRADVDRVLLLVEQVARALHVAHEAGLVHRDVKPGNIMVTPDDRTVLIDFGLARDDSVDLLSLTRTGDRVGTPTYMAPEQVGGRGTVDRRTDVYALGVTLFEALTKRLPFEAWNAEQLYVEILKGVRTSARSFNRHLPGDLDIVLQKALDLEPARRYATAAEFADDLHAVRVRRPILARRASPSIRLRRWVQRNPVLATFLALVTVALFVSVALLREVYIEKKVARANEIEARRQQGIAERREAEVRKEKSRFDRLSVVVQLETARAELQKLQPAWPAQIPAMETWLEKRGNKLEAELAEVKQVLKELREKAPDRTEAEKKSDREGHEEYPVYDFADGADKFLFETMQRVERDLAVFLGPKGARIDVQRRLAWAAKIDGLTKSHRNAGMTWAEVQRRLDLADDVVASELYGAKHHAGHRIRLEPQTGLVPIGMNPKTKLLEFYHLRSAYDPRSDADPAELPIPRHEPDGSIPMTERTGIVFVFLPGGTYTMGAQKTDPDGKNYDPWARTDEQPCTEQSVVPLFLARHELTQGQWMRLSLQANPSRYAPGAQTEVPVTLSHPVEQVDWNMSTALLARHGLQLPTEVELEYGCRGGRATPWFPGETAARLEGFANLLDQDAKDTANWSGKPVPFRDGHVIHAPVGTFRPNPFGLYDVHGNVWEWSSSLYGSRASRARIVRGGSFFDEARHARSSNRFNYVPTLGNANVGLRPARSHR